MGEVDKKYHYGDNICLDEATEEVPQTEMVLGINIHYPL